MGEERPRKQLMCKSLAFSHHCDTLVHALEAGCSLLWTKLHRIQRKFQKQNKDFSKRLIETPQHKREEIIKPSVWNSCHDAWQVVRELAPIDEAGTSMQMAMTVHGETGKLVLSDSQ